MKRRVVSGIVLMLLLTSMLSSTFIIQPVEAGGTIYIRADGSVEPSTAPISTGDNITYTFTDNIYDELVIERSNIIIDGGGFTLQGTGSGNGFDLAGINNVTIKDTNIKSFYCGIYFNSTSQNVISGNNVTNNVRGIYLYYSSDNNISRNNVTNNFSGIWLFMSSNNTVFENYVASNHGIDLEYSSNNTVSRNKIISNYHSGSVLEAALNNVIHGNIFINCGLKVYSSYNNSVMENVVNGKPLVYLEDVSDYIVKDAGQVIAVNCTGIRIEGLDLSNTAVGVQLLETSNAEIINNDISNNNHGIWLSQFSSDNTISRNHITNNIHYGIWFKWFSNNNTISGNNITDNFEGIRFYDSSNNMFYHNNFIDNARQVYPIGECINFWDDGYPSGGNYWSDYDERYPDAEELDDSGIWDTPYVIDENNQDSYPLMNPWTPIPEDQPPTCVIELQKDGVEISEIDVWEFFDIYVGDSTDDTGIKQVRFSSDDDQDNHPTGEWTQWYDWETSLGDWNASTKIKRWSFTTHGYKEVWAEVKDDINQTDRHYANIFVRHILPVPYYYQGDTEWCVPTSMSMIFKYYGQNIHSWDIAKDWGWSRDVQWWKFWEPTRNMVREYFNDRALVTEDGPVDFDTVKAWVDGDSPVLVWVSWWESGSVKKINHVVAIVGYSFVDGLKKVYINDPSGTLVRKIDQSIILPYIAVELDWNDVVEYIDSVMAVRGTPHPPKGTIDIIDKAVGFWHGEVFGKPEVYSWVYGLDEGLVWEHEPWHSLTLDPADRFQLGGWMNLHINNHLRESQTYGIRIEFTSDMAQTVLWTVKQVEGLGWNTSVIWTDTPLRDLLIEYGEYTITLSLWDAAFAEKYDEVVFPSIEYAPAQMFYLDCPANLYVTDPLGRHVGVDPSTGEVVNEIPGAVYTGLGSEPQVIIIPNPLDGNYAVEVIGTDQGNYSLTTQFVTLQETMAFVATDIPTFANAIHQYTIDWEVLSLGEEGVIVMVDSDGDGVFEHSFTSDNELTHDEFMLQTATTVDFDPDTLNLKSEGKWVTVYIELPEGYDPNQIDISSIMLNGTVPALAKPTEIGDYDGDGIPDLMVKFDTASVIALFDGKTVPGNYMIEVTGTWAGIRFKGTVTIRVISPP